MPDRLAELNAIPEILLAYDEWRERELLRFKQWRERLVVRCATDAATIAFHEQYGRKLGDAVRTLSYDDRVRSHEDQQRKYERDTLHTQ